MDRGVWWATESQTQLSRWFWFCCCLVAKSCLTLRDPMDYSPQGSSVHGISQAIMLEWTAISFSRGSSWFKDWTYVSCLFCTASRFLITAPPGKPHHLHCCCSVTNSCLTLWNPMDCSTPCFSSFHCLPEFVQIHVHWVGDANRLILCRPLLLLPSIFPSIRVFSSESTLCIR